MSEPILSRPSVLIAGAGPTGLVLALGLARRNVPVRIVDQATGPGEHSRAMVVHARTLEFYRQFGFADEVIDQGIKVLHAHLREGGAGTQGRKVGHEVVSVPFGDIGGGLSPYPFPLAYPQDDHQRLLIAKLRDAGVEIEWRTKVTGLAQDEAQDKEGVLVTLERAGAEEGKQAEIVRVPYLCGCDGAHSAVREQLRLGFPGGTYPQLYYVIDAKLAGGFERDLVVNLGEKVFTLLLPVRSRGVQRLIGLVPPELAPELNNGNEPTFEDLRPHIEKLIDRHVTEVNWLAQYRVHHRVAEHFRVGCVFVLGDAAHVHSPLGGQGMNTGIGDAINLGWKLAMIMQGRADAALLDTYEAERIGFARQLVATTDRAFGPIVAGGLRGRLVRRFLVPLLFTLGTRLEVGRRAFFRRISQIEIEYEDSEISEGEAGHIAGGDRLPWVPGLDPDNFAPLSSLDWQVHVYGSATARLREAMQILGLPVHVFPWTAGADEAGLRRDALYLARPDGYVALALADQDPDAVRGFLGRHRLKIARS
jgi:2-polyprenyl-6-methoxyphenol hydroxylase-like FAD-dependent oxidoreductase